MFASQVGEVSNFVVGQYVPGGIGGSGETDGRNLFVDFE